MVVCPVSPHLLTLRGIFSPHLVQLWTGNRTQLAVVLPHTPPLAVGGERGINCAEVGTFRVWNFFEVSIPPFPLIPPFLLSPSLSHPHLFLSLSPPLLIRLSLLFFVSFISVNIKARLIFWESARGDFRANFSVRHTAQFLFFVLYYIYPTFYYMSIRCDGT